jgi:DNA gyrase inhibitor GyrI
MAGLDEAGMGEPAGFAGGIQNAGKNAGPRIPDFQISMKQTEASTVVILPKSGHPDLLTESALSELKGLLKKQGVTPQGDFFFRIWSDAEKTPLAHAIWEVGCPVREDVRVRPPLEINRLPRFQMASASLHGILPDEKIWQAFAQRISDRGWIPAFPPAVEIYGTDDGTMPFWIETEMQMQAFDPGTGYPGLDIRIIGTDVKYALLMHMEGPFSQADQTRDLLKKCIRENKIPATDRWFFLFYSDPAEVPPGQSRWAMGCELSQEPDDVRQVEPPFELRRMPGDSLAVTGFPYPLDTEFPYMPMILQTLTMGYLMNGPAGQAWTDDPFRDDTAVKRSEFFIPVKSAGRFAGEMETFGKALSEWVNSPPGGIQDRPVPVDSNDSGEMGLSSGPQTPADSTKPGFMEKVTEFFKQISGPAESRPIVTIEPREPYWVIRLPVTGTMAQMPAVFEKVRNYMQAAGIQAAGPPITWQYDDAAMIPEFEIKWEAGYRLQDSTAVKQPFQVVRIPAREVMTIRYADGMDEKAMNMKLTSWMYHNDYRSLSPNTMMWTNGLYEPGKKISGLVVEVPMLKLEKPYPEVRVFNRSEKERNELILPRRGPSTLEDQALEELKKYVKKNKMDVLGDYFIQYHTNPEVTPPEDMVWDAGVPIRGDVKADDPFRVNWMHGRDWACVHYEGDHLAIPVPFWISYMLNYTMNGFKAVGLPRKVFLEHLSRNEWKVELQVPVQR